MAANGFAHSTRSFHLAHPGFPLLLHLYNLPPPPLSLLHRRPHASSDLHLKISKRSLMSSPRFFSGADRRHHFLDSCFLCKKPLARNEDIFMYRGDAAFCSRECRWEQMDMDEALEKERRRQRRTSTAAVASACSGFATDTAPVFAVYELTG